MSRLRSNVAFVRLFLGRLVTNVGDSLYLIGAMWIVWDLTGSSFYTGVAGFLIQAPSSLQFLVGPLVDRWNLRNVLVSTQLVQGVCVLAIPLAAAAGYLSVWVVLLIMPILSFLNQFVYPAQNAALPQIVEDDQLVRANSLFSTAYQGTGVVFNAISGVILAAVGTMALFVLDSITFAVAAALFFGVTVQNVDSDEADEDDESYLTELREGFSYLRGSVVLWIVAGSMFANVGAGAMIAVLPAFADALGGPRTYGLLMAAVAGGPLIGAVAASKVEDYPYGYSAIVGYLFSGLCLFAALSAPGVVGTVALLFVTFVPIGVLNVMFPSLLQSSVDDTLLGRVSSVSASASTVSVPVGSLVGGAVADLLSPAWVIVGIAGVYALVAGYHFLHPGLRSLPSVDEADETLLGLGSTTGT